VAAAFVAIGANEAAVGIEMIESKIPNQYPLQLILDSDREFGKPRISLLSQSGATHDVTRG
jgi:hypothetical protein